MSGLASGGEPPAGADDPGRPAAEPHGPGEPSGEAWLRLEAAFADALDHPPPDPGHFAHARFPDEPKLAAELLALIESHSEVGPVPAEPGTGAASAGAASEEGGGLPERIGPYRILRSLGEGGMGMVLLAVREGEGFEQTVALKLIRGAVVDPLLRERLESERRILARLEHPGIARLIDGGVTEDGQPYYAMEYVPGEDLLSYADSRRLDVDARLALFAEVCDAVHHAHQQLVVHRDLKPSNLLVTAEGRPKLLDFGIAKSLEASAPDGHTLRWVTPAYASPEQVRGEPVSTLSDVYSLGVLLCELLVGSKPYPADTTPPAELARVIAEELPTRPSVLVWGGGIGPEGRGGVPESPEARAERRDASVASLARRVRGDLDVIVLKALAKEPARRYGSAMELAADLRNVLASRPVTARPDSAAYRAGRFLRRHRTASVAAVLLVAAIAAGGGATLWQARETARERDRAEGEATRARQVTGLMTEIFRLGDPTRTLGDTIGVRQVLSEGTARVEETLGDDPVLQATLLLELARVYDNLGIPEEAGRLAGRALELRALHEPGTLTHAEALGFRGLVASGAGDTERAVSLLGEAIEMRRALVPSGDTALATLAAGLGWEVRALGEHDRAMQLFEEAMELRRAALGDDHALIASTMMGLAAALHDQGSFDEAEALFRSAIDRGAADRPDPVAAAALVNLGMLRRLREEYREAEPLARAGLEMRLALFARDHPDLIVARESWGQVLAALGRYDEARMVFEEALALGIPAVGNDHPDLRSVREGLANVDRSLGNYDAALARLDTVLAQKRLALGEAHPGIVVSLIYRGDIELAAGADAAAEASYQAALAMGRVLGETRGVYGALSRAGLAQLRLRRGDLGAASELLDTAEVIAGEALRPDHRYALEFGRVRARLLLAQGRPDSAVALLEGIRGAESRVRPSPHPRIGETDLLLGRAHAALGDADAARAALTRASAEFIRLPEGHALRREAADGG